MNKLSVVDQGLQISELLKYDNGNKLSFFNCITT